MKRIVGCLLLMLVACNLSTPTPAVTIPPTAEATFTPLPDLNFVPPAPLNPNCPTTPTNWVAYVIEPGNSLSLLADQTDSAIDELVTGNCLENPDGIIVGETIYLPRAPVVP